MLIKMRSNKAQTLMEFALLFGIVIMALMTMQVFVRRGIQQKIRVSVDDYLGQRAGRFQYEPGLYYSQTTTTNNFMGNIATEGPGGRVGRTSVESSLRTGLEGYRGN